MRKQYITSLKGIACLLVAFGHFWGIFKYAATIPMSADWFLWMEKFRLDFLLHESFWLYLFFVVSGYLVARSKITNLYDLVVKGILRFLRLALPIFAACLIVFLFTRLIPFSSADTKALFENKWLQNAYASDLNIRNILLSPIDILILGRTTVNSTFWVLRYMMAASFLIYFLSYLKTKAFMSKALLPFLLALAVILYFFNEVLFVCVLGAILCYYENSIQKLLSSKIILIVSGILCLLLSFVNMTYGAIATFSWLLMAIPNFEKIRKAIEAKPLAFLGDISFGVYAFHWPIFCSLGCYIVIKLWHLIGCTSSVILAIAVSTLATILISVGFYYAVERPIGKLLTKLKDFHTKFAYRTKAS